jgi:sarcosine oxidase subunit beta
MVIEFSSGFWFRREGEGLIMGMRNPAEPSSLDTSVDWAFLPQIARVASHRLPLSKDIGIVRGWAGSHADTPDRSALVGQSSEVEGFFYATGFSGHGFMHSPATGKLIAQLILGEEPFLDISSLNLERFSRGSPVLVTESSFV